MLTPREVDDWTAWFKAQGMQDREAGKPMRPDTIFRICSMSKPITSVAVMMLYEQGRFRLEDPVSKYLPGFKNPKILVKPSTGDPYTIPASHEITIRDLLRAEAPGRVHDNHLAWGAAASLCIAVAPAARTRSLSPASSRLQVRAADVRASLLSRPSVPRKAT